MVMDDFQDDGYSFSFLIHLINMANADCVSGVVSMDVITLGGITC